jgi:hypothetical protein
MIYQMKCGTENSGAGLNRVLNGVQPSKCGKETWMDVEDGKGPEQRRRYSTGIEE